MTYIPDPIERMEANIDRLCDEWDTLNRDVPKGSFRCPCCRQVREGEPIETGPSPDSSVCCYECLSTEMQAAYDSVFG